MATNKITLFIFAHFLILNQTFNQTLNEKAEIKEYNKTYTIENRELVEHVSLTIAIYSRNGEALTQFKIHHSKNNQLEYIKAHIEDPNGKVIRPLGKKEIKSSSAVSDYSMFSDDQVDYFTLRHNTYPYFIKCEYQRAFDNFLHIADWSPVYHGGYPTISATLNIQVPTDYKIRINQNNIGPYTKTESTKTVNYYWKSQYTSPYTSEPYSPPASTLIPNVEVFPLNFWYGTKGSNATWVEFGNWQNNLMQGSLDLPDHEKNTIDRLIKEATNDKQKINILYDYLQTNTRYINISLGVGGLKPYPASYVAKNKFGDCKALTNYMRAILKHAGIESHYSIVNAGKDITPIEKDFPGQQFNHVILCVPVENDTIWLECTSKNEPAGYLGTFTQGRQSLVIKENSSYLTKTPSLSIEDSRNTTRYNMDFYVDGSAKVQIKKTIKTEEYEYVNYLQHERKLEDVDKYLSNLLPLKSYLVDSWKIENKNGKAPYLNLNMNITAKQAFVKYGNDFLSRIIPAQIVDLQPPASRKNPVHIPFPVVSSDTIACNFPPQINISQLPKTKSIKSDYGYYHISYKREENKVEVLRDFVLFAGNYSLDEYTDFYTFIENVKKIEKNNIILLN